MWPRYLIDVKHLNDGIFLNVEAATKFYNSRSVLDEIRDLQKEGYSNEEIIEELISQDPSKERINVITLNN